MKDYYAILGLSRYASAEEIKMAYRALAKKHHPDLNPGNARAEEQFKELSLAYETLSDPLEKKKYDFRILYGFVPQRSAAEREEELKKQEARKQAYVRHTEKKKKLDAVYRRRSVYAGISVLIIIVIGLNLPGETSRREQRMRDFVDRNQDDFLIARSFVSSPREIQTADSPYDSIFGEGRYDDLSENSLLITNNLKRDVIACLVQNGGKRQTIRNEFIRTGDTYNMAHVPEGRYYLRLFTGRKWNPGVVLLNNIKGSFTTDSAFLEAPSQTFRMEKQRGKYKNKFSIYTIMLNDSNLRVFNRIAPTYFFH